MAPDTVSLKAEPPGLSLRWSNRLSLTGRILAVNLFALALMAGGLFFLDSYRSRLLAERQQGVLNQAVLLRDTLELAPPATQSKVIEKFGMATKSRVRLYDRSGAKVTDSFDLATPTYALQDLAAQPWQKKLALRIDQAVDFLVGSAKIGQYSEPAYDHVAAWEELRVAKPERPSGRVLFTEDFTHMISGAAVAQNRNWSVLITSNPRDVRALVRAERFSIAMFSLLVLGISVLLSLFLARTIVHPIQHLARAAVKVRLGRSPEVMVPRLPNRRDEIGMLARALSDMSIALRQRIDATESFAADVAHEIKNPLASLRSALDGLEHIENPELRGQLMAVAKDDVQRMDRLISDISDASRIDAQLAKANFDPIDLGDMIEQMLIARENRRQDGVVTIAFARPRKGVAMIEGEDLRLERVINNLIDNAVSFSPAGGVVEISATRSDDDVIVRITDQGPGIASHERELIFRRFYSERPSNESFGKHSGLGLAIARTIVEGHHGSISAHDREDGANGASFLISLPAFQKPKP
jgi:two-component system, OmpR family, sensor histidine kinase ChvG